MPESTNRASAFNTNIFFNCPFDHSYKPIFDALVFAAYECGYIARCALEVDDAGQVRIEKILKIIRNCRLGVHDISRTELDADSQLPRFNMPFELGLFVGAARFGAAAQKQKVCLVLDRERYRFQKFISDIAGQDIASHGGDPAEAIKALRKWLSTLPTLEILPGGAEIVRRYKLFQIELPSILSRLNIEPDEATFSDYANVVRDWLVGQPRKVK
jgi:hypothetical protein